MEGILQRGEDTECVSPDSARFWAVAYHFLRSYYGILLGIAGDHSPGKSMNLSVLLYSLRIMDCCWHDGNDETGVTPHFPGVEIWVYGTVAYYFDVQDHAAGVPHRFCQSLPYR